MRKISFNLIMAALSIMAATSCGKEIITPAETSSPETSSPKTVTLGIQIGEDSKTYIDADTRVPMWTAGDMIVVNSNQQCITIRDINGSSGRLYDVREADHYYALYPQDIILENMSVVDMPHEQTYSEDGSGHQKVYAPMGAYSTTTSLTFRNLASLLKVHFTNDGTEDIRLIEIKVKGDTYYMSGFASPHVSGNEDDHISMQNTTSHSYKDVSLSLGYNNGVVEAGDTKDFYIVLPPFAEQNVTITLIQDATHYVSFSGTKSLDNNKIVQVKFKASDIVDHSAVPTGAICGKFTINSDGDQVFFSNGNLRCTLTADKTGTWAFADEQWDFIGNDSGNAHLTATPGVLSSYPGTVDIFKWSTDNASDYYGISSEANPYIGSNFKDWGDPINERGYYMGTWRTLTQSEWEYITTGRNEDYRYAKGSVHGVKGMILFPDNYTEPLGLSDESTIEKNSVDYPKTIITDSDWSLLEMAGCVFMPAAGEGGLEYSNDNQEVFYYWLSTAQPPIAAYYAAGYSTGFCPRVSCYPVRLVQDVE